jgi:hypothetical protein
MEAIQTASWDKVGKDGSPTSGAKAHHLFTAVTVDRRAKNDQIMPYGSFRGTWHSNGTYSLSTNNKAEHLSISSDANSLIFTERYTDKRLDSITYVLNIDLATKRFSEEWNSHFGSNDEKDVGRCIVAH